MIIIGWNESFISYKVLMAKLCGEYKLYNPLHKHYGDETEIEINTHITSLQRIDFIFVSIKLLHLIEI